MAERRPNDENTYVYVDFYVRPDGDVNELNETINNDADKLAEEGALVLGIQVEPVEFAEKYLMVVIHYRAKQRSTLFD
jgi:hypothetical protein